VTTAVVFDLDGTLADTTPDIAAALNETLERRGAGPLSHDVVRGLTGFGAGELVRRAFAAAGAPLADDEAVAEQTRRYLATYAERPAERSVVHEDAVEALAALAARGVALGVCTNKDTDLSWTVLRALGLAEHLGAVVGADAVPRRKPDPGHLQAVLDALEASPREAVYVGDNAVDVGTAAAAGVRCAIVSWGTAPIAEQPTWARIDSFEQLVGLIDRDAPAPTTP
jgi:phosphoglycolate phosphatase